MAAGIALTVSDNGDLADAETRMDATPVFRIPGTSVLNEHLASATALVEACGGSVVRDESVTGMSVAIRVGLPDALDPREASAA